MGSIMILDSSESFRREMEKELQKDYRVYCCAAPEEAIEKLNAHRPDGLIVNLMLHGMDGLYFLEHLREPRPRAILARSSVFSPYVLQKLTDLGVSYPVLSTCAVHAVAHRIRDILNSGEAPMSLDHQKLIAFHLQALHVPYSGGYDDLRVGIPIFAQDPDQSMVKEFYPAVAQLRGRSNWKQVERAIRDAKEHAYDTCGEATWKTYFPDSTCCPTNKAFIARLAEFLADKP